MLQVTTPTLAHTAYALRMPGLQGYVQQQEFLFGARNLGSVINQGRINKKPAMVIAITIPRKSESHHFEFLTGLSGSF